MGTKTIDGATVEYKDTIFNHTTLRFSFRDRLRILIGRKVYVNSNIYYIDSRIHDGYIDVVGSVSTAHVEARDRRRRSEKGFGMIQDQD